MPIPASGCASSDFNCSNIVFTSPPPSDMWAITSDTAPIVFSNPQNVPSKPRKIINPVM